ncbi:hypothetical protein JZ751_018772 [Albula glossodonta]|uniref:Uncharacterized protein n=1 Tax=Albula glossodonta TaxID=121402 RepID=A0A8T2NW44_9TELE|nr:hypothetical protein JZ751_018772 [Albula glossodonta]
MSSCARSFASRSHTVGNLFSCDAERGTFYCASYPHRPQSPTSSHLTRNSCKLIQQLVQSYSTTAEGEGEEAPASNKEVEKQLSFKLQTELLSWLVTRALYIEYLTSCGARLALQGLRRTGW